MKRPKKTITKALKTFLVVMAKAMGEELPFLNEAVAKTPNNENDTETPKESVIKTPQEKKKAIKLPAP